MVQLIGLAVSLGLADSLNPTTIGPALVLASRDRARRSLLEFTAGFAGIFFLGGAVFTVGPGQALLALVPHPGPTVKYIAETVVGVVMLVAGVILLRNRERLRNRETSSASSRRLGSPMVLGVTIATVELPTDLPYLAVMVAIIAAELHPVSELILLAIYCVCFLLPLLVIAAALALAGDRADALLQRSRVFMNRHGPVVLGCLALAAGVIATVLGVTGLTSRVPGGVGHVSRHLRRAIKSAPPG